MLDPFHFQRSERFQNIIMDSTQPTTLLKLPSPVLANVLGFLGLDDQPGSCRATLLASKVFHQAGEAAVHSRLQLKMNSWKLQQAEEAGQEGQLLAFLRRTAADWRKAKLDMDTEQDLRQVLVSLAPATGSGLRELQLHFGEFYGRVTLPEELKGLTALTGLTITQSLARQPAQDFANLSSLTALRSLEVLAPFSSQISIEALNHLQKLTRLQLVKSGSPEAAAMLGWEHLSTCRALRQLDVSNVVPDLSGEEALAVWQQLEQLNIWSAHRCLNTGFWAVLPQLGSLTCLSIRGCDNEVSRVLSSGLPACSSLLDLTLGMHSRSALPQLPTSLTSLRIKGRCESGWLPGMPMLQCLEVNACPWLAEYLEAHPVFVGTLTRLTRLQLMECDLRQLPAPLATLPALEELSLWCNVHLSELPNELACLPNLRVLDLSECSMRQVPPVLGFGLASRLEVLNFYANYGVGVTEEDLKILGSLTALTHLVMCGPGYPPDVDVVSPVRQVLPVSCALDVINVM